MAQGSGVALEPEDVCFLGGQRLMLAPEDVANAADSLLYFHDARNGSKGTWT